MRRRTSLRVGAVAAGLALLAAACGDDDDDSERRDHHGRRWRRQHHGRRWRRRPRSARGLTIASFQALTGDAAGLGEPIKNGAELAINQFNEANPDCQIKFQPEDSQGSPDQAPGIAKKLVDQTRRRRRRRPGLLR